MQLLIFVLIIGVMSFGLVGVLDAEAIPEFLFKFGSRCEISSGFNCFDPDGAGPLELGDGQFTSPNSSTFDSTGNFYVSDNGNHRVQKFDSDGNFILKWGERGGSDGQFFTTGDIKVDNSDNVYVIDGGNHRVQKFDSDGNFILKIGTLCELNLPGQPGCDTSAPGAIGIGDGQFWSPRGVAVDSSNNVYIADRNNRIQKFDSNGIFLSKFGSTGPSNGQFDIPSGIDIDNLGNIYVVDQGNNRIQKFDSAGNFLLKWGSQGSDDGQFNNPISITVDNNGNVVVTQLSIPDPIQKFDSNGLFLSKFGTKCELSKPGQPGCDTSYPGAMEIGDGQYDVATNVEINTLDKIYLSDANNHRIQVYTTTTPFEINDLTATPGIGFVILSWSTPDDGALVITDYIVEFKQSTEATYRVFDDGMNVSTTVTVPGLSIGVSYDFRVRAVYEGGTVDPSNIAMAIPTPLVTEDPDWFNSNWQNRKQITIPPASSFLTDFPVLVSLMDTDLSSARTDGFDFVFTSEDGTIELSYEREKWDASTGEFLAWVKVPVLSSTEDTILYLYYNNPNQTTDKSNPQQVWTNGFADVWHLDDTLLDSANTNHGTNFGSISAPGKIGDARDFDGVDDKVTFGNVGLHGSAQMSKSIWFKTTDVSAGIFDVEYGAVDAGFGIDSPGLLTVLAFQNNPRQSITIAPKSAAADGEWHHVAFTYDGNTYRAYFDGEESGTPISISDTIKHSFTSTIGKRILSDSSRLYNGILDEARIYNVAKSADWIATEWNNQNDPGSFYNIGPQEDVPQELSLESLQMQINDIISGVTAIAVDWFDISNRPAGLDDGDDDTLAGLGCTTDQIAQYDGTDWNCANPQLIDLLVIGSSDGAINPQGIINKQNQILFYGDVLCKIEQTGSIYIQFGQTTTVQYLNDCSTRNGNLIDLTTSQDEIFNEGDILVLERISSDWQEVHRQQN